MGSEKFEVIDQEFEDSVDDLTDAILENIQEEYFNELDPFESYAQKVRLDIHKNLSKFRKRFLKGYHVIINEMKKE